MPAPEPDDVLPDDLVSAKEGARLLKMNVNTLYRWGQRGRASAWKRGRSWFFSQAELLAAFQKVEPQAADAVTTTSRQEQDFIAAAAIRFGLQESLQEERRPVEKPEPPPSEPPAWLLEELRRRGIRP